MAEQRRDLMLYAKLSLVYVAIAVGTAVVFRWLLPQYYLPFYPAIGGFYWLIGMGLNFTLNSCCRLRPERLLNSFMLFRMVKLFLTIIFMMGGLFMTKELRIPFAVSVMGNYLIYTIVEIYVYYMYTKRVITDGGVEK